MCTNLRTTFQNHNPLCALSLSLSLPPPKSSFWEQWKKKKKVRNNILLPVPSTFYIYKYIYIFTLFPFRGNYVGNMTNSMTIECFLTVRFPSDNYSSLNNDQIIYICGSLFLFYRYRVVFLLQSHSETLMTVNECVLQNNHLVVGPRW